MVVAMENDCGRGKEMVVATGNDCGRGKDMAGFLIEHHLEQLRSIILSPDPRLHYPLYVE